MDNDSLAKILESHNWKWAKDKKNPHAYTLRKHWSSNDLFREVVLYIREHGFEVKHWGKPYTVININGYRYWTMGYPLENDDGSWLTILINKAKVETHEGFDGIYEDYKYCLQSSELLKAVKLHGRVLDIGCGAGHVTDHILVKSQNYTGIDQSEILLNQFQSEKPDFKGRLINTDFSSFYNGKFDTIISLLGYMSYVPTQDCKKIRKMLSPEGKAYLVFHLGEKGEKQYLSKNTALRRSLNNFKGVKFGNYKLVTISL